MAPPQKTFCCGQRTLKIWPKAVLCCAWLCQDLKLSGEIIAFLFYCIVVLHYFINFESKLSHILPKIYFGAVNWLQTVTQSQFQGVSGCSGEINFSLISVHLVLYCSTLPYILPINRLWIKGSEAFSGAVRCDWEYSGVSILLQGLTNWPRIQEHGDCYSLRLAPFLTHCAAGCNPA